MDTYNISAATSRTINGLDTIVQAMIAEFEATERLIDSLKDRICKLEARELELEAAIGNALDGDAVERMIEDAIDTAISDKVSDLDLEDKVQDVVRMMTFTVTVD